MKVCIIGAGKTGYYLAKALLGGGNEVTMIDTDAVRIQGVGNSLDIFSLQGDALKKEVLEGIDIKSHDLLIAATAEDEKNMAICAFAKALGCPRAVARVRSPEHIKQWDFIKETFGIDQLINPDYACARAMFKYLTQQYSFANGLFSQDGISIFEFDANQLPNLAGKKLYEASPMLKDLLIGAVSRNGKIIIPKGGTVLEENDTLYAVGQDSTIRSFRQKLARQRKSMAVKRVMIAGGGKTGFFLAKMLEEAGIAVKIVERDEERCKALASELDNTVVLNGDASEINTLREENLEAMDAFIAATGSDEANLLLSLLVKQYKVPQVAAKVSRQTFLPVVKDMSDVALINPQEIIANEVLSFVRRNGIVLFSKVINGQAEFKEIQAEVAMPITKKPLAELEIPEGIIVIAVHRGKKIIIPNGNTQISAGDRVILLSLLSAGGELESLLTKASSSIL